MTITYAELRSMHTFPIGEETLMIGWLSRRIFGDPLFNPNPDYQRGRVWTDRQCSLFVGFLLSGGMTPPIFVQRWADVEIPDELIDGLQRCTAIHRFLIGEVPMELADGRRCYFEEMSPEDRRILTGAARSYLTIRFVQFDTRADVLRFYLRLNRSGTPHTDAEIDRVRDLLVREVTP